MSFYDILGVARNAEPDVVEAAYRAMMRRYHPDRFIGSREEAERRSKEINEAYATLRNAQKRAAYDAALGPESAISSHAAQAKIAGSTVSKWRPSYGLLIAVGAVAASLTGAFLFLSGDPESAEVSQPDSGVLGNSMGASVSQSTDLTNAASEEVSSSMTQTVETVSETPIWPRSAQFLQPISLAALLYRAIPGEGALASQQFGQRGCHLRRNGSPGTTGR